MIGGIVIFIDYIKVLILGIIEGLTEFLPVSSTGHLVLAGEFIRLEPANFANTFMIIIQLGAIMAVVMLNFKRLNPFSKSNVPDTLREEYIREGTGHRISMLIRYADINIIELWKKIIVSVLPAVVLGLLFDDLIDTYLFNPITVAITLVLYGIIIVFIENRKLGSKAKIENFKDISYATALGIGLFQCLAMVPGTSRSAATIIGALLLGASRIVATEYSFFLAIPTMLGATALKIFKNISGYSLHQWGLIVFGALVSFVVGYFAIERFVAYIKKHDFKVFGYYRIVLGIIVLVFFSLFR